MGEGPGERGPWINPEQRSRLLLLVAVLSVASITHAADPEYLTGDKLRDALARPTSVSWTETEFRRGVAQMLASSQAALVLDRRIDPSRLLTQELPSASVLSQLEKLGTPAAARAAVTGRVVYFGPPAAAARLRTLIALRDQELEELSKKVPAARRQALLADQTLGWEDVAAPRDRLARWGEHFGLEIEGLEQIPHDLWGAAVLPEVRLSEALSLVLIQFDLTFAWRTDLSGITLGPIPPGELAVEKTYAPKPKTTAADLLRDWQGRWPDLEGEVRNRQVVVRGTAERHDEIAAVLNPRTTPPPAVGTVSLSQQMLALPKLDASVTSLMKKLEMNGIAFDYDPAELKAAGIDLTKRIQLQIDRTTADDFFRKIFEPLGVQTEIDGNRVRLTPKK